MNKTDRNKMNEKPILFSSEMVRAILAGRKTQTRRSVKPQPCREATKFERFVYSSDMGWEARFCNDSTSGVCDRKLRIDKGDILYVREMWDCVPNTNNPTWDIIYAADGAQVFDISIPNFDPILYTPQRWRPSIHMPRAAARIFLRVTGVRTERVQDISEEDAIAEGVKGHKLPPEVLSKRGGKPMHEFFCPNGRGGTYDTVVEAYHELWDSINAMRKYSWKINPWVWVYTFEECEKPEV